MKAGGSVAAGMASPLCSTAGLRPGVAPGGGTASAKSSARWRPGEGAPCTPCLRIPSPEGAGRWYGGSALEDLSAVCWAQVYDKRPPPGTAI